MGCINRMKAEHFQSGPFVRQRKRIGAGDDFEQDLFRNVDTTPEANCVIGAAPACGSSTKTMNDNRGVQTRVWKRLAQA
ncbi:hypothetical protein RISK_000495 [Rhodopirellula islandica]|uniref:Uncharacterized protein n=2 Tax=Rhodopirellula islandica TaxID=595434 RepID=A0A0J1BLQ2_RHOIS|nr:hypothetical protein RISK_000495 [Rhodopirellula islandica]